MTTPFWCLLVAVLIPYSLAGFGAYQRVKQLGELDNKNWRADQLPRLTGIGSRVYAAQANAWEALAVFTAALATAHFLGANADAVATTSLVFIVARLGHALFYLLDLDKIRSLAFVIGWGSCLYLFYLAASG